MPHLIGENIMLREYRMDDIDDIQNWVNDGEVTKFLSGLFLYPHTRTDTENFLKAMLNKTSDIRGFVIAHKDGSYIGQVDLMKIDWVSRKATLGIVIGKKELHGKGIGTEAISLLLKFAFDQMNLNKVELTVNEHNMAGRECYKKCGFVEEGRLREDFYSYGEYSDMLVMSCLKKDFYKL
ncbi:MAG: GNAT family protein [Gudongella sp.]|jgi:RimJ/RimL family protein N-acetyltransferase|nr:GNAT family protein [Gudongella sp.]